MRTKSIAVATTVAGLGNFLFQLMVARTLDPGAFGALAALLGIVVLFEVPANALQVVVGREVAAASLRSGPPRRPVVPTQRLVSDTVLLGALVCVVFVGAAPLLEAFLRLPNLTTALLVALDAVPIGIAAVPKGVLVGEGRYRMLGAGVVAGTATKLGLGIVLVHGGLGIEGAMAAIVAGEIVTAAVLLPAMRHRESPDVRAPTRSVGWSDAGGPALAYTGYWLLTAIDLILGRHYLSGTASGVYAAASTAAQIVLILPGVAVAMLLPRLVAPVERNARRSVVHAVVGIAAPQVVVVAALTLGARPVVGALFGGRYATSSPIVVVLTLAGAALGIVNTILHFDVARRIRLPAALSWLGVAVVVAGTTVWHASGYEIATTVAAAAVVVLAGMAAVTVSSTQPPDDVAAQAQLALLDADLDLTVVVPYYNPGDLLAPNLRRLLEVLDRSDATFEVIAVCDGSTDGSERTIEDIDHPGLVRVTLPRNEGKGAALRIGMARGRGRWLGFLDADGDLDPVLLEPFQALVRLYDPEVILGSKRHPLSEIEYPPARRAYSWGYQQLVHLLFKLDIRDTQTGIKIIRRDVLAAVLPRMAERRFAFDLELFVIARHLGYRRFLEAPVRLHHQFTSTVSWHSVTRTLRDTVAVLYRLRVLGWYDEPLPAEPRSVGVGRLDPVGPRGTAGTSAARHDHARA